MIERDIDAVRRQRASGAFGPFDQRDRAFRQWRQADLFQFALVVDAIEVGVNQGNGRQVVALREREGRAWNLQRFVIGEIADHGAGSGGLAGAEIARKRDDVAGADQQREVGHQMRGRCLICERHQKCRGRAHSAALRCTA